MAPLVLLLCNRLVTNADDDTFNAESWLRSFGYLSQASRQMSTMQSSQILSNAVSDMQRFYGLEVTGEMDDATLTAMRRPRCGVPDKSFGQTENGMRRKRYTLTDQKWDKNHLTYRCVLGQCMLGDSQKSILGISQTAVRSVSINNVSKRPAFPYVYKPLTTHTSFIMTLSIYTQQKNKLNMQQFHRFD
ncbi:unnamed protein product [Oncorhynchus mykiss]|uniref:Peptidoglycan binding-like domain-containing protein n=1 Tax=Oncorhynchus mykiss TaxID=8022 RepID=A0A060W3D3_ONCMY|nr:unnamed protein product [Oncorhynchus mykiss]